MAGSRGKLIVYGILFLALLTGFVRFLLLLSERAFSYELAGVIVISLLMLAGCAGYGQRWGERLLFFFFILSMGNLIAIWYFFGSLYVVLLLLAAFGFVLSVPRAPELAYPTTAPVPSKEEKAQAMPETTTTTTKTPPPQKETSVKHTPGKYVASTRGTVYHAPRCEWAKKISRSGRVWFTSKDEAVEKGFKAHDCVE